jgi:spore germination protein
MSDVPLTPDGAEPHGNDGSSNNEPVGRTGTSDTATPRISRRRTAIVAALVAAASAATVATLVATDDDTPPPPPLESVAIDAWAPYWVMERSLEDLQRHGDILHDVSPFAYEATAVDRLELPPTFDQKLFASFVDTAREAGLTLTPSIVDALPSGAMASILASPTGRARHVAAIVALAADLDADGIDIDYEKFAFDDPRSTWDDTRVAFADFIDELATALHADGRRLVVSVPPVYDDGTTDASGYWVYDIARIATSADQIRVMAYGYSGQAAGPVSPLAWVERSIDGVVEAAGGADKVVLGVPLYGTNVPTSTSGTCPPDAPGTTAVTLRTIDDLIERRGARPQFDDATNEWTFTYDLDVEDAAGEIVCTQTREVNYVDANGARARIDLALDRRLGGVALWALGYEDDSLWTAIADITP